MINRLPTLTRLIRQLQSVPYLASKNLYRVASYFLELDEGRIDQLCQVLTEAKKGLAKCEVCCSWREAKSPCIFCSADERNQAVVCVVETWQELVAIENTGGYAGVYHVLGGRICPLDGIGPEDLTIEQLGKRVEGGGVSEIILAMNLTPEGEATSSFIAHRLVGLDVKVSCLARGLPVGSSLEYMDRLTVYKALSERRPF